MHMNNKLTVIIPFLNEGEEVLNTVKSIRESINDNVDILLINDASDDGYDYEKEVTVWNVEYIKNQTRQGVAASRDLGVDMIKTPYFLLLDAHMRFYNDTWADIIIEKLSENDRKLLCCQTKTLKKEDGIVKEAESGNSYGAFLLFGKDEFIPDIKWNPHEKEKNEDTEPIPCVLGAGYATSKRYWQYLKGLQGLIHYGSDEAYISMKVWLEGGICELLKNVVIGHIYRNASPYKMHNEKILYNQLLISALLFPTDLKFRSFTVAEKKDKELFRKAYNLLMQNSSLVDSLKKYYRSIFTRNFQTILTINDIKMPIEIREIEKEKERLPEIAEYLWRKAETVYDNGIFNGRAGLIIFFCHYAHYSQNLQYDDMSTELWTRLNLAFEKNEIPVTFGNGLCGIGWCIEYLSERQLLKGKVDDILLQIDCRVMERDPLRISDWNLNTGLGGILCYVLSRLRTEDKSEPKYFDKRYLEDLLLASHRLLQTCNDSTCRSFAMQYIEYHTDTDWNISPIQLTDFMEFPSFLPKNSNYWETSILDGCIGYGLKLMLSK